MFPFIFKKQLSSARKIYQEQGVVILIRKTIYFFCQFRKRRDEILWFFLKFRKNNRLEQTIHGQKMYLSVYDFGISKELAIYKTHEPLATKLFRASIKKGMNIIDIGANIGYYVLIESQIIGSKGKIIAIEPQQENISLLRLNIKRNHLQNVKIIEAAIGDYCKQGKLYVNKRASNTHSLLPFYSNESQDNWKTQEVKIYSIDALTRKLNFPVDFIRMDIEGYELNAIKGMNQTLKRYKPSLAIELHYDVLGMKGVVKLLEILKQNGYKAKHISDRDKDFAWIKNNETIVNPSIDLLAKKGVFRVATVFFEKS